LTLRFELADGKSHEEAAAEDGSGLVGQSQRARPTSGRAQPLPEAPSSAVAALDGLPCNACGVRLVPEKGETSEQRRRRAAALTRVCAGCRQTFHEGCAREVARMLGGRTLLRVPPGQPLPWLGGKTAGGGAGAEGDGGLLATLTGQRSAVEQEQRQPRQQQQQRKGQKEEGVTEELERLLREEEVVRAAVARDGHWFHSFTCARVAAALAAQAAVGPVAIDDGAREGNGGGGLEQEGKEAAVAEGSGAAQAPPPSSSSSRPSPFRWLKDMRESELRKLGEPLSAGLSSKEEEEEEEQQQGAAADKQEEDALQRRRQQQRQQQRQHPAPPSSPPPSSSRTWALIDLSRLRAEPGDPPGPKGPGKGLRPDVDALVDVLLQAYGPGAADLVVGLPAAVALGEEDGDDNDSEGGGKKGPRVRRRLGGGLRDGRYAVLLRDSADNGAQPLCAALLDSYGPQAAVVGLLATRALRRGEGHAGALLGATADFLRDGLGARRMLAAGVPVESDPVCKGLFLGKGGEKAVQREQERVQGELKRQRQRGTRKGDGGNAGEGGGEGGDLVAGLLAMMGNPSLAPFVSKEKIHWSPAHAPRFRRLGKTEAQRLAAELPALGRRLELSGVKLGAGGGLFGRGRGNVGAGEGGREWLVKDLVVED
jgi:hypothetical protein